MESADADRRLRVQYENAIYHVMSRAQRSHVLLSDENREAFFEECDGFETDPSLTFRIWQSRYLVSAASTSSRWESNPTAIRLAGSSLTSLGN